MSKFNSVGSALLTVINRDAVKLKNCKVVTNGAGLTAYFLYMYCMNKTGQFVVIVISKTEPHPAISPIPEYAIHDTFKTDIEKLAVDHYETYKTMLEEDAKSRLPKQPEMVTDHHPDFDPAAATNVP